MFYLNFVGLPFAPPPKCVIEQLERTGDECKNSRWWYLDPKTEKPRFSNQFLYACYGEAYPSMEDKNFEAYFFKERKNTSKDTNLLNRQGRDLTTTVYQKTHPSWVFICQALQKRSVNQQILK